MIAYVRGEVAAVGLTSAVVEVGGVGLDVQCTPGTLADLRVGSAAQLATSMVVREDSWTLYGFADEDAKLIFEIVQTASGIGAKTAQAMLAVLGPDDIRAAVAGEDVKTLTRVPGIGQKGAQRIILDLKDRIGRPTLAQLPGEAEPVRVAEWHEPVASGLVGLGWSAKDAEKAVAQVAREHPDAETAMTADIPRLLRAALQILSKA